MTDDDTAAYRNDETASTLRDQLSEARAEVERIGAIYESEDKRVDAEMTALEAKRDAAVSERDELAAQVAAARDIAGSIELYAEAGSKVWKLNRDTLSNLPARAKALQDVVEAARDWVYRSLSSPESGHLLCIDTAVRALTRLDQPEQEQE